MATQRNLARLLAALFLLCGPSYGGSKNTPQGRYYLYVGNYTGPASKGIQAFRYDAATLAFDSLGMVGEMPRPSFLALHPNGRFLYAVSEMGNDGRSQGALYAFAIDRATGRLTFLNRQPSGGGGACHLVVDKTGKFLLVANYGTGSAAAYSLKADGRIGGSSGRIQFEGSGPDSKRQTGPHAHAVVLSPDNRFLFVPDLGTDRIHILRFDANTGSLTPNTPGDTAVKPGAGPRHFTFSPDGRFGYAIDEMGSSVTAFSYQASSGALTEVQAISTLPEGFKGENNSAEIQIDSTGRFLYASNRGHDSIAVFSRDSRSGRLALLQIESSQGRTPRNFTIDPTGRYLLAANQDSNNIVVFTRDPETGRLAPTGKTTAAPSPVCLLFTAAP